MLFIIHFLHSCIGIVFSILNVIPNSVSHDFVQPSNQPEAYFNGSSYLRLQTSVSLKRQTGISFRTCLGGSLMSQQQNGDLIELTVTSAGVVFIAKTNGIQFEDTIAGNYIDNQWHTVQLLYQPQRHQLKSKVGSDFGGNLTMNVDGQQKVIANGSYHNELLTSHSLYNEGAAVLLIGKKYNGCLLEGPSLVFDSALIMSSHNVRFEECPIPEDSCAPRNYPKSYTGSTTGGYCMTEPCMRHGTCVNTDHGYTCNCYPRYTGKNCELEIGTANSNNPCERTSSSNGGASSAPSVCGNGGTCVMTNGTVVAGMESMDYWCSCLSGYAGKHCEIDIRGQHLCKSNPCLNGATCLDSSSSNGGATPGAGFLCLCAAGFSGSLCEVSAADECKSNPCRHGGVCIAGYANFTCDCSRTGYTGRFCAHNINECYNSNPCRNRGICFDHYGGYVCQCLTGYVGVNCEYSVTDCMSHPCLNNGKCTDRPGGYDCTCLPGFTGKLCETPPGASCSMIPCQNDGVCIEENGHYFCNCTDHWTGVSCEKSYINGGGNAGCDSKPCLNNATCIATALPNISSSKRHDFICNCLPGFEGDRCEADINECSGVICPDGKECVDLINHYECRCPKGQTPTVDGCVDLDVVDPCVKQPCLQGSTCHLEPTTGNYSCLCVPGFTGPQCNIDIDECNLPGVPICNHGICMNKEGSFQCYCRPGYTGETCNVDFDECLSLPCRNNATCLNKINNYECVCPPGYMSKDCSIDINECEPMPCTAGSTCLDGINEFTCVCLPGLTGRICDINIDDCEPQPCLHNSTCIDGLNSYTCNCTDTGYTGVHCEENIDDCVGDPCVNGAECLDDVKDYRCMCFPGYTGKNCEEDINECDSNPCQYSGVCLEHSNVTLYQPNTLAHQLDLPETFHRQFSYANAEGYECICVPGVTGANCEIDIDECQSNPCFQGSCKDQIGGYYCECADGYEGEHCDIDIDECVKYEPCVNGSCVDRKADYFCDCHSNYGGKNCSVALIGCATNPCLNGGSCKPYLISENVHKFNCSCPNGFHGHICDEVSTMSLSGSSEVVVNTTREEGYDIQFRFKTTLGDGLLALGRGPTYYILELSNGRLNLHSSLLNKWEGVFIGSNLNDSKWQRVFVAINATHLVLSANDEQTIYPITFNENYNASYTSFPTTYIGGIPSNLRKLTHGPPSFVGCTEDVLINGEWVLPMQNRSNVDIMNIDVGCLREAQCNPNPCHSDGHCTDLWRDFQCVCERPYLGHTCQYNYTAATFGYENITDSLVTITVADTARRAIRNIVDISMFIRTRQSRGQIFYLGSALGSTSHMDETYIVAQLESGELLVRIQFNGTPEAYTVGGVKLDNGYNHLIEVIRNVTLVQVKLNATEYFRKTISATGQLDAQVLFLGGQPQPRSVRQTNDIQLKSDGTSTTITTQSVPSTTVSTPLNNMHFKGIIQDVQVSNGSSVMVVEFFPLKAPDLSEPTIFGAVTFDKLRVLEGVYSDDSCKVNPCHNGVCVNTWNDYECICPRGYKGKDCTELEFCELEKCPSGSKCNNLEDGYECLSNATFDGKSTGVLQYNLVVLPSATKQFAFTMLEINYRTRSWGTIFFAKAAEEEDYFVIFVYHNVVVVEWRFSPDEAVMRRTFKQDHFRGQWLILYFTYKDTVLKGGFKEAVVDDSPHFEVDDFDLDSFSNLILHGTISVAGSDNVTFDYRSILELFQPQSGGNVSAMGGYFLHGEDSTNLPLSSNVVDTSDLLFMDDIALIKADKYKLTDAFKGCLGEIRISGLLLPFFTTKELYPKNHYSQQFFELSTSGQQASASIGCILCYTTDCFNQGFCISPTETYQCNCTDGYTAADCSIDINECEQNQCQNNATCVDLVAKYECECLPGYEGVYCEIDIDECRSNPCKHGGTCIDLVGTFKCECSDNYVGKQCEAPLLITCDNKPCRDGSTCQTGPNEATGNNFTCVCTEGMEGHLCDIPFCHVRQCDNNGYCNSSSALDVPYCQCHRGFEGQFCETNIDDCVSPIGGNPCQNGGVCIDGVNRFDCNCTGTGFNGLLCELDINECDIMESPCGLAGVCRNTPGNYECLCEETAKCGHFCQLDDPCAAVLLNTIEAISHSSDAADTNADDPSLLATTPCGMNGECISQCFELPDYVCNCHDNFTGRNCTDLKVAAVIGGGSVNIVYIIVPIILIVIGAGIIGLILVVNVAKGKRATRGTYSPSAQEFCNPRVELDHVLKPPPEERLI